MNTSSGKVRKHKSSQSKRRKLRAVVKMLAAMEPNPESPRDPVSEFLVTGRTGRRNAMADILGTHATTSSGDLPERLQSLCTTDSDAGPSSAGNQGQEESNVNNVSNVTSCGSFNKPNDQPQSEGNS